MKNKTVFKTFSSATNQTWFSWSMTALRIGIGLEFFLAGVEKFGDWSAEGYLAASTGPFASFFQALAGSAIIDTLNVWGLTLIGLSLILGIFVRPAAFFGATMMLLYYFAQFEQNTHHGYIEHHIIYILIFLVFLSGGVGHALGLDGLISANSRKKKKITSLLFG